MIADDALLANSQSAVLSITGIALACVFMVLKFDAWKLKDEKNILKLMYIVSMAFAADMLRSPTYSSSCTKTS